MPPLRARLRLSFLTASALTLVALLAAPAANAAPAFYPYRDAVQQASPAAYWRLDGGGLTGQALDSAGLGGTYNATWTGSPTTTVGALLNDPNLATAFDGDTWATTPTMTLGTSFTMEAWVRPNSLADGDSVALLSSGQVATTGWELQLRRDGNATTPRLVVPWSGGGSKSFTSPYALTPGWHHISVAVSSWQGTATIVRFSQDGQAPAGPTPEDGTPALTPAPVLIGSDDTGGTYAGDMDELAIYSGEPFLGGHYLSALLPVPDTSTSLSWSGTFAVGQTVHFSPPTFYGAQSPYPLQWRRCNQTGGPGANCEDITGATSASYLIAEADAGKYLSVTATATSPTGLQSLPYTATYWMPVRGHEPYNPTGVMLFGEVQQGGTVSVSGGPWEGAEPITYSYAWQRCTQMPSMNSESCAAIGEATNSTYSPTAEDRGRYLRVVVTATNSYGSATAVAFSWQAVTGPAPTNITPPHMTSVAQVGRVLSVYDLGTWDPEDTTAYVAYWEVCDEQGLACEEADYQWAQPTGSFRLGDETEGHTVRAAIHTYSPATGSTGMFETAPTALIQPRPTDEPTNVITPTITGRALVGQTLTANPGQWAGDPTPELSYQWQQPSVDGWSDVANATGATLVLTNNFAGEQVRVVVRARNEHGADAQASVETAWIAMTSGTPYAAEVTADSPRGFWELDGTDWDSLSLDASGNGAWASVNASELGLAGAFEGSQAPSFAAPPMAAVLIPGLATGHDITDEGWVNTTSTATMNLSYRSCSMSMCAWQMLLSNGKLVFEGSFDGEVAQDITGDSEVSDGSWHHVAATVAYDTALDSSRVTLYVDGEIDRTVTVEGELRAPTFPIAPQSLTTDPLQALTTLMPSQPASTLGIVQPSGNRAPTTNTHKPATRRKIKAKTKTKAKRKHAAKARAKRKHAANANGKYKKAKPKRRHTGKAQPKRKPASKSTASHKSTLKVPAGASLPASAETQIPSGSPPAFSVAAQTQLASTAAAGPSVAQAGMIAESYTGMLDELAEYDHALSAQRIHAHYLAALGAPPENTVLPAVSGLVRIGMELTANPGTWSSDSSLAYQWQRCTDIGCSDIDGADTAHRTVTPDDLGQRIRVVVTATNENGDTQATSPANRPYRHAV